MIHYYIHNLNLMPREKLSPQQINKLFNSLSESLDELIRFHTKEKGSSSKEPTVSYKQEYDKVYNLTKQNRESELLHLAQSKLVRFLKTEFKGLQEENSAIALRVVFENNEIVMESLKKVFLFLDENRLKQQLINRLKQFALKTFNTQPKILTIFAASLFAARNSDKSDCLALLSLIDDLDEKQEFFERHLISHYELLLRKHYEREGEQLWKQLTLVQYLQWCKVELEKELKFGRSMLVWKRPKKDQKTIGQKGQVGLDRIQAAIYSVIVEAYKPRIYQADETQLFQRLTLPILELFKFSKSKEVQGHIQWFMARIQARLNAIPINQNAPFLTSFCQLFHKVATQLKDTQGRFEINYRAVFTFEQWINNQKFNIPMRLNLLLDGHLRTNKQQDETNNSNKQQDENINSNKQKDETINSAILIFKLVKEKTLFQNLYRRLLLDRLVQIFSEYRLQQELRVVELMEKECGDEWTKRIKSICQLFLKNREAFYGEQGRPEILRAVIVEENDWPFEHKQTKIALHPQLAELTPKFQKIYLPANQNHRLLWSPLVGSVLLTIRFKSGSRDVLLGVEAANLLLWLQNAPQTLKHFLSQTGYKLDEIQTAIQTLITQKLLLCHEQANDRRLELVLDFPSGNLLDLVSRSEHGEIEVKAVQELKADRKLMVEAIIVKIMKTEKTANRSDLLQKTAPLLAQRGFKFNADFVEKSIDRLLDKEFLRDFEDGSLGYIA